MPRTPRLTPRRAAHLFFHHFHRSHPGATTVVFVNSGGRSKLTIFQYDGTTARLCPAMHRNISLDWEAAAAEYAKAVYGPRSAWPAHITITATTESLTAEDAARHLGDHVWNDRVYTFNSHAANAAHEVMTIRQMMAGGPAMNMIFRPSYDRALSTLAFYLGLDHNDRRLYSLARSYTRQHPTNH